MSLLDSVLGQLTSGNITEALSKKTGADTAQTQSIIEKALPALLGGIATNAASDDGAASLFNALEKDHDGSILDDVDHLENHAQSEKGSGILQHVLGGKLGTIEEMLNQETDADKGTIDSTLKGLAPLLMGALGKAKATEGLDLGGLATGLLSGKKELEDKGMLNSMLVSFLDKDGDGDIKDDLLNMGMSKLKGKFFG